MSGSHYWTAEELMKYFFMWFPLMKRPSSMVCISVISCGWVDGQIELKLLTTIFQGIFNFRLIIICVLFHFHDYFQFFDISLIICYEILGLRVMFTQICCCLLFWSKLTLMPVKVSCHNQKNNQLLHQKDKSKKKKTFL